MVPADRPSRSIYACNIKEDDLGKDEDSLPGVADVKAIAAGENAKVLVISAKIEEDIAQMDDEEKDMFLEEMGIGKSGLDPPDRRMLRPAGADFLPDRRRGRVPRVDDSQGHESAAGRRQDP